MRPTTDTIILVGGFPEVIELAEDCRRRIAGIVDPVLGGSHRGYPVIGTDADAAEIHSRHADVPVFVGVDEPEHRARLVALYAAAGFAFASLVHPQATVSRTATHGVGVMVQCGAHLSANVVLGDHVRINVGANVMHDARIDDYSTVAPNAVVLGRVRIHDLCYVGAHATVLPDVTLGKGSRVGAHANVTKSVRAGATVVGNPARSHGPRRAVSGRRRCS